MDNHINKDCLFSRDTVNIVMGATSMLTIVLIVELYELKMEYYTAKRELKKANSLIERLKKKLKSKFYK